MHNAFPICLTKKKQLQHTSSQLREKINKLNHTY
jgi:hypothetical protein